MEKQAQEGEWRCHCSRVAFTPLRSLRVQLATGPR